MIHKLKAAFARHGIVETLISDNGPCYKSNEFESFTKAWEFTHVTTSPHYPQSNGLAEKSVQIARPPEPTFSQERNNLHAMEVTNDKIAVVKTISMASHCPLVGCGPMIPFHLDSGKGLCVEKG